MAMKALRQEWWLDTSALPDLMWARLDFYGDHHVQVLDLDGQYHHFTSEEAAKDWLRADGYAEFGGLIRDGDVPLDTEPPSAIADVELIPRMYQGIQAPQGRSPFRKQRKFSVPLLLFAIFVAIVTLALRNSESCQDGPGGPRRLGIRHVINEPIIPCGKECCRPNPWTCRCTGRCPCIPILRSKR